MKTDDYPKWDRAHGWWPAIVAALSLASVFAIAQVIAVVTAPALGWPPERVPATQGNSPPFTGRAMFAQSCAHCHGDDGTGSGEDGDGPDLHGLRIGNARIAAVIREGIHGEMPSFAKKYSASEISVLIGYLRSWR